MKQKTTLDLETLVLKSGAHVKREDGVCIMEAVAWFAGKNHTDHPPCVSPVIGAFLRSWNDSVDEDARQVLKPYIPRVVDTAKDGKDEARAWLATDWLIREYLPVWLELAKITDIATELRAIPEITGPQTLAHASGLLAGAQTRADAAGAAAWDAAGDAAGDAARAAARDAAPAAARAAAWAAARDAAGAAARDAAGDAAWAAAGAAARAAAGAAARAAARAALKPTVEKLRESSLKLLDRMVAGK